MMLHVRIVALLLLIQLVRLQGATLRHGIVSTSVDDTETSNAHESLVESSSSLHEHQDQHHHRVLGSLNRVVSGVQGESKNLFGASLALNAAGTVLASGGPQDGPGQVFVFSLNGKVWKSTHVLVGKRGGDAFGSSVALSADGNIVAAGTFSTQAPGYVQIYFLKPTGGYVLFASLNSGLTGVDGFGSSVSLASTGWTVAVGAPEAHSAGGRAAVFRYNGTSWRPLGSPFVGSYNSTFRLGKSVALSASGDIVAIGEPGYGSAAFGRIRLFQYAGTTWTQIGGDIVGNVPGGRLGQTVSLSANGQRVAATVVQAAGSTTRIYQYQASAASKWVAFGTGAFTPPRVAVKVVSLSGDGTVVATGSSYLGAQTTANTTSAAVYQVSNSGVWTQVGTSLPGGAVVSLSRDGKTFVTSLNVGSAATVRSYQVLL